MILKEDIKDEFRSVRNRVVADHYDGKVSDTELIEKRKLIKDMEQEAIEMILTVNKLAIQRNE